MFRFLLSADWQLGITREHLGDEAQARWAQARFDAIRAIGGIAASTGAECVVVAGDVFETNQVDRRTVKRALEALSAIPVPVFLLPGNHDPLDAAAVWRSPAFAQQRPPGVVVLDDARPRELRPGIEIAGAPWTSKRPLANPVVAAGTALLPAPGVLRVLVGHGMVDSLEPDPGKLEVVPLEAAERAIAEQRYSFLALGDRHSRTEVGTSGRIWYPGTPEPTDFDEKDPGHVLEVELDGDSARVVAHRVGTWTFQRLPFELGDGADLDALERALSARRDKERTALRLALVGSLTLSQKARLDALLDEHREVYASLSVSEQRSRLAVRADDGDFADLDLAGFARAAVDRLRHDLAAGGPGAGAAREALALLLRLARSPR